MSESINIEQLVNQCQDNQGSISCSLDLAMHLATILEEDNIVLHQLVNNEQRPSITLLQTCSKNIEFIKCMIIDYLDAAKTANDELAANLLSLKQADQQ